jgi:hypothetical protein
MKEGTFLSIVLLCLSLFGWSQSAPRQKYIATEAQKNAVVFAPNVSMGQWKSSENSMMRAKPYSFPQQPTATGKINAVNPVLLGSSGNIYTIIHTQQNQVAAHDTLNSVVFVHGNNPAVSGGSSDHLQYDVSTDGGVTWFNNIGFLNPQLAHPVRFPNIAFRDSLGSTNPLDASFFVVAPTLVNDTLRGALENHDSLVTSGTCSFSEGYPHFSDVTYSTGPLVASRCGRGFTYITQMQYDSLPDLLKIFYIPCGGLMGSTTYLCLQFGVAVSPAMVTNKNSGGKGSTGTQLGMAPKNSMPPFSQYGWVSTNTDLIGRARDSVYSPVFFRTTDGGMTWGDTVEVDLNQAAWVADTLKTLWVDSSSNPISDGIATTAFESDLTVDMYGNPHLAVVIGSRDPLKPFGFKAGLAKFLADVHSPDGGITWVVDYVAPILTFRTPRYGQGIDTVHMDNFPQISRSEDGQYIFYSWADSDTAQVTGNQNGIGFGEFLNFAPNLRIAALHVPTGARTYPKLITDLDPVWDGKVFFPTMAPTVLTDSSCWHLPIVVAEMTFMYPGSPANFHYFGNDAVICDNQFCDPDSMRLAWDQWAFTGANPLCASILGTPSPKENRVILGNAYPNPTIEKSVITFQIPAAISLSMHLVNMYGQTVAELANGEYGAGAHRLDVNTANLPCGVYFYTLRTDEEMLSKRLVVAR